MTEPTATPAPAPVAKPARKRTGPNRRAVVWARPDFGKTTLAMTLASDPTDPRWRWVALVDGDQSASSVSHLFADPAVARHFKVKLEWMAFIRALDALLPAVASGECGAVVIEGLCPLYDYLYGLECAANPDAVAAGGNTALKLRVKPAAYLRAVHSALTRLEQAAPEDSGFVMVITMHAKKTSQMGSTTDTWAPDLSDGVWDEIWRLTPVAVELDRFGDGAPRIVFEDPTHKIRRIKNSVVRDEMRRLVASGRPEDLRKFSTLPAFLDMHNGAERFAAKQQIAKQAAADKPAPPTPPTALAA
jgi:hypothetical protein